MSGSAVETVVAAPAELQANQQLTIEDTSSPGPALTGPLAEGSQSSAVLDGGVNATPRPSFRCESMRTMSEATICRSSALSQLDREYAALYARAIAAAPDTRAIRREAVARLRERNRSCETERCLQAWFVGRIGELQAVLSSER
jgi:uncharacterized protein YecT (DUF1311 family)